jgi:hypothetical protein
METVKVEYSRFYERDFPLAALLCSVTLTQERKDELSCFREKLKLQQFLASVVR